jgi:hypothetical protein
MKRAALALVAISCLYAAPARGQAADGCFWLCQPELKLEPSFTVENLFNPHRIAEMDGDTRIGIERAEREVVFETILALDIPTEIPRVGLTLEMIFVPFASGDENPFTGTSAEHLGRTSIRDNSPEIEFELNIDWLDSGDTGGWLGSHFDIVDKISPAERPGDAAVYSHKLNLEWDTAVHVFHWLPDGNWLRNVEVEGSLDYVATGLPRAGDRIGDELYLDDASRWSLSLVFVMPLVPLVP